MTTSAVAAVWTPTAIPPTERTTTPTRACERICERTVGRGGGGSSKNARVFIYAE